MGIRTTHWVDNWGLCGQHATKIERMNRTSTTLGWSFSPNTTTPNKTQPYQMCLQGSLWKILGVFFVSKCLNNACLSQLKVVLSMKSPVNKKQIQILTGRLATLNRFISKYLDLLHLFFSALKSASKNGWSGDFQKSFDSIKQYLTEPHILSQPLPGEELFMYLAISIHTVNSVLLRIENGT